MIKHVIWQKKAQLMIMKPKVLPRLNLSLRKTISRTNLLRQKLPCKWDRPKCVTTTRFLHLSILSSNVKHTISRFKMMMMNNISRRSQDHHLSNVMPTKEQQLGYVSLVIIWVNAMGKTLRSFVIRMSKLTGINAPMDRCLTKPSKLY